MIRPPRFAVALLVVSVALAGCVGLPDAGDAVDDLVAPDDWANLALPFGKGHDHLDPAQHLGLSTPNFQLLGWDPLVTAHYGKTAGGHLCGDVGDSGERRIVVTHSFSSDVAFVVADVTDAANPQLLGELVLPNVHVYDLAVLPGAEYVALATSRVDRGINLPVASPVPGAQASRPVFRNACTGEITPVQSLVDNEEDETPYGSGAVLVDVRDPTSPVVADYKPLPPNGAHSIFAAEVGGTPVVLASTVNSAHAASYFTFLSLQDTPTGRQLVQESVHRPVPTPTDPPLTNGHMDGWIHTHPGTGAPLAYLADWDGGLAILDVSDLKQPREIGRWSDYKLNDPADESGSIHGAYPIQGLWNGKHYTVIGQEILDHPRDTPTGKMWILDTTDPANPETVGAWTLPVDVEWGDRLMFSTHYGVVVDRTLFVATYHGGVWAVDLTEPTAPRSVGVFVPDRISPSPPGDLAGGFNWTPIVLDVVPLEGNDLVVFDGTSGAYTVRYDPSKPAPAVDEWAIPGL